MNNIQSIEMWRRILGSHVTGFGDDYFVVESDKWSGKLTFRMDGEPRAADGLTVFHVHPGGWYVVHQDGTHMGGIRGNAKDRLKRLRQMIDRWEYQNR